MKGKPSNLTNVLMYIGDSEKERQILKLCEELGLSVRKVSASDTERTVGSLTGLLAPSAQRTKEPERLRRSDVSEQTPSRSRLPDFLVFAGMSGDEMDVFLRKYREENIPPTGLKAMVTIHNMNWSLSRLIEELKREQAAILLGRR